MPGETALNLVYSLQEVWPWGEVASVEEVESRLAGRWPANLVEAAIWKVVGDGAAAGHLLFDLEQHTLDRILPLALLPPGAPPLTPHPLPETLLASIPVVEVATTISALAAPVPGPTFDASTLPEKQRSIAICKPSNKCWLEHFKPKSQQSPVSHVQRWDVW